VNVKPVALITGAGRGIGRGIALELARNGFDIAANDIAFDAQNLEKGLNEVRLRVEEAGAAFLAVPADISDLGKHHLILNAVLERFGRVDCLINNAGVAPPARLDILETTPESFDRVLSINLRGGFFLTQRAAAVMLDLQTKIEGYRPCIIFITSISADVSSINRAEYCISKAGLSQAATIFAHRLAEYGIQVFEIRPGIIQTDMTMPAREKYDRLIAEGLIPQQRWGMPEDVAKAAAALAGGEFAYSTGAVIEVSGGMNIRRL